mmetsp:Transcript_42211/g.68382  ORF Transcript_42211/g.68382 Transcript_42211/m.68382 type:complete len:381 (+) Transcript_42211:38-1180(+)
MFSGFAPLGGNEPLLSSRPGGQQAATRPLSQAAGDAGASPKGTSRTQRYIDMAASMADSSTPQLAGALRALSPVLELALPILGYLAMGYMQLYRAIYAAYLTLPRDELQAVIGLVLCFFGGTFVTLIAAVEAFRTMGGESLYDEVEYLKEQVSVVWAANIRDEGLDDDKDGIADVEQLSTTDLTKRKVSLAMVSIVDPSRVQTAVGKLWAASLAVLATLKLQFAQVAAYALALAGMLKFPVVRLFAPALSWALGPALVHWCDTIIDSGLKVLMLLLVWYFAKIRAAFYSGLRGGKLFGEAAMRILEKYGLTNQLPDFIVKKPFIPDESYLDEAIGYSLALVGFYFQVSSFFVFLPFPLDWILWPVTLLEQFLEIQISWSN